MKYECEVSIAHKLKFYVNAKTNEEAARIARQIAMEKKKAYEFISGLSTSVQLVVNGQGQ